MEFTFLSAAGVTMFTRSDAETAHWVQEEMTVNATFPFVDGKVIERGQRLAFRDPATDTIEVFEVRSVSAIEPDHYQQISAEAICLSELQDEHINTAEITGKTAAQALTTVLAGTMWSVGTSTASGTQNADISRGSVWQAVNTINSNWNVYITPRVVITNGAITGRFLDISPAQGTWRGVRLSVRKNMLDANVTYNDEDVLTALYGYGGTIDKPRSGGDDEAEELTFADVVWTATGGHPAKPAGQTYLEDPSKTAIYGRNGRPRFGYYQNSSITDPNVLLQKTWEALQRTYEPRISITGTVADLYRMGYKDEPLRLHDIAIVEIEETGEAFQKEIIRLDVDLIDPTGNRPDIGDYIPNIIYINRETNQRASGRGGGGGRGQTPNEAEQVETFAEFVKTNDMIGMVVGTRNGGYYVKAGEIVLAINKSGETGQYESTALINADHVNISGTTTAYTLAGSLERDAQGRLIIKDAGGLYVRRTEQGVTSQFGVFDQGNLTGGVIVEKVNGSTNTYIYGDHINISGNNTVRTLAGAMEVDLAGNLVIKEGAGLYVQHTSGGSVAKFGVYDSNNLTGGIIVQKINGDTTTAISGDRINISGTSTVQALSGAMELDSSGHLVIKEGAGLYLQRTSGGSTAQFGVWDRGNLTGGVMVSQINGQSSLKLSADVIDIDGLVTSMQAFNLKGVVVEASVSMSAPLASFTGLTVNGDGASWQSKTVVTGVTVSSTSVRGWVYQDAGGTQHTSASKMVTSVSRTTDTINYLGK